LVFAAYSQIVPVPDEGPAVFVFRIISMGSAQRDAFVACLAKSDLPFWRDLKKKGLLAKVSVFETISVDRSEPGVPAWNFVVSSAPGWIKQAGRRRLKPTLRTKVRAT
jgi:hypothetical protein